MPRRISSSAPRIQLTAEEDRDHLFFADWAEEPHRAKIAGYVESTRRCRPAPGPGPAPVSDLRAARLHQLVLAGRALGRGARLVRGVPQGLGGEGRAVGVLGRARG